jgi:hypothetical protein
MEAKTQTNQIRDEEIHGHGMALSSLNEGLKNGGGEEDLQDSITQTPDLEIWNKPKVNKYRYLATLYTFIVMGMNDAAYGVRYNSKPA